MTGLPDDPLSNLLVDADEVDKQALAGALNGLISIDSATGRPLLSTAYNTLDSRQKVLSLILARKAAHLLGVSDSETISNKDLVALSGLPKGTVAPSLKRLREARLVAQDSANAYFIPNPQLPNAIEFFGISEA